MSAIGSILVVDQEPTIVDLLVEVLTDEGYIADTLPDGASALAAIDHHRPALILLDVGRLDRGGVAQMEELRRAGLATMPIVLMTTAPHNATPLLTPGLVECVAKPFDLDELLSCVARYVQPVQAVKPAMC